jgi:multidrug efflux pump subunit AcrB
MNKELFPNVDFDMINIRIAYPGSSAEDAEKLVGILVERAVKGVDGLEEINIMSLEGAVIGVLKVDPDYSTDEVLEEVRNAVNIIPDLPDDADSPVISKITNTTRPVIKFALSHDDEWKLRKYATELQDHIETYSNIASVELEGYRDEIFDVRVDPNKIINLEISLGEVVEAIRDRNINVSAGNIKLANEEILVRTIGEIKKPSDVEEIFVRTNDSGVGVQIKDIAVVERALKDLERSERANGKTSIFLQVIAKSSSDVVETVDYVKAMVADFLKNSDISFQEADDLSFYVKRRLGVLTQNGFQGIFLVTLALFLFMNLRVSVITALGAPFAFLVAFTVMDMGSVSLNLISMFGMILVLGMLVDDSIIVAEQFYQYVESGMDRKEAAKKAAHDTLTPVTVTILTTMLAFGSLLFMSGIMGKFLVAVPVVVLICLAASWLECFFILPGHLKDFSGHGKMEKGKEWFKKILGYYGKHLNFFLKYAKSTVFAFTVLFIGSLFIAKNMRFELFPADDVTIFFLNTKAKVGTPLKKTQELMINIEKEVMNEIREDEFKYVRTISGYQISRQSLTPRRGSHYGSIMVEVTMDNVRKRSLDEILAALSERIDPLIPQDTTYVIEKRAGGPPQGQPVNVELFAEDLTELLEASKLVKQNLLDIEGVLTSELDFEEGKKQLVATVDEREARRLGVSNTQVAMALRRSFEGIEATTIRRSKEDIEIWVRLNEEARSKKETLERIYVTNKTGQRIPINKLVQFETQDGAYVIRRYQGQRTIAVSGSIDRLKTTSREVNGKIEKFLSSDFKRLHPEIRYNLGGENEDTQDSLESFKKAMLLSVASIFIILVLQFTSLIQPFIVLSAVPFGMIGVVLAFLILDMPIGFMALMGILGLVGVVINDSIVLVTFINREIEKTKVIFPAIIEGCKSRLRPVILTTVTTVVGLLPVAHAPGGDPFLKPMATSFAYGLLFSTSLTLVFVPCCYVIYQSFLKKFNKIKPEYRWE